VTAGGPHIDWNSQRGLESANFEAASYERRYALLVMQVIHTDDDDDDDDDNDDNDDDAPMLLYL